VKCRGTLLVVLLFSTVAAHEVVLHYAAASIDVPSLSRIVRVDHILNWS